MDEIKSLQKQLSDLEQSFEPLRKARLYNTPEWYAKSEQAGLIRKQLWDLTGDSYGLPKKVKQKPPSDDLLLARYDSPDDVPAEVMAWLSRQSIITGDATDAVRWSRIVNTSNDSRHHGESLTLYRAIGRGNEDEEMIQEIRPGDWVTTSLEYAQEHLRRYLGGDGSILEMDADGCDVLTSPTGNHEEAIYAPMDLSGPADHMVMRDRP